MIQPVKQSKLEALKFKVNLQHKNLGLMLEHNQLMKDINKNET